MERQIQLALEDLALLQKKEEAKRAEVVTAKQDTSSIEKLREKKLDHYKKAMQKNEEAMIDELVSTKRVMEAQSA
jgi:flagellar FliJ protein